MFRSTYLPCLNREYNINIIPTYSLYLKLFCRDIHERDQRVHAAFSGQKKLTPRCWVTRNNDPTFENVPHHDRSPRLPATGNPLPINPTNTTFKHHPNPISGLNIYLKNTNSPKRTKWPKNARTKVVRRSSQTQKRSATTIRAHPSSTKARRVCLSFAVYRTD